MVGAHTNGDWYAIVLKHFTVDFAIVDVLEAKKATFGDFGRQDDGPEGNVATNEIDVNSGVVKSLFEWFGVMHYCEVNENAETLVDDVTFDVGERHLIDVTIDVNVRAKLVNEIFSFACSVGTFVVKEDICASFGRFAVDCN